MANAASSPSADAGATASFAQTLAAEGAALIDLSHDAAVLELCDRAAAEVEPYRHMGAVRVQDAWRIAPSVRALAALPQIIAALRAFYRAEPFPFQTLNFFTGSQQAPHSDLMHFTPEPLHMMCGVWFALEDVRAGAGPLVYYPGSHAWPVLTMDDVGAPPGMPAKDAYAAYYEPALRARIAAHSVEAKTLLARKGQAFVWAANLVHGGAPVTDPDATRRSLVTHYFFRGCSYYTLMTSRGGRRTMRLPEDVRTGRFVWPKSGAPSLKVFAHAVLARATRRAYAYRAGAVSPDLSLRL